MNISVIIPVYQAEKYIERCVNSVVAQTYTDWELILVDDGSTDNSGMLCDQLAATDSRVRVIHQSNQGANKARRNGWRMAKGEWVTFVDSDDYIPDTALADLMTKANSDTDIVIGWMNTFQTQDEQISIDIYRSRCIGCHDIDVGPVAHLYRNVLYDDFVFDIPREITVGEDNLMNIRLAFRTNKPVQVVHEVVYYYDISNTDSTMHRYKQTLDYEETFHIYRLSSIPYDEQQKYIVDLIGIKAYRLLCHIKAHPWCLDWRRHNFSITLLNEINKNHYLLNKANRYLLNNHNRFIQWILVKYAEFIKFYLNHSSSKTYTFIRTRKCGH